MDAGLEAQKLWNARACGKLDGDNNELQYFLNVEKDRYGEQDWAHAYFQYDQFKDKKVLEIGVGQGTDLSQFAKGGAICHGVDITDNHLELTKKNFDLRQFQVELTKGSATELPYPDNYFDCVYSFGVLHHIPEIQKVIAEVNRVLKPGGCLMIALYNRWSAFHLFSVIPNGIISGLLFTHGYKSVLATIETGADGVKYKPYVDLYTRKKVKKLLSSFSIEDVSVHQLKITHFGPRFIKKFVKLLIPKMDEKNFNEQPASLVRTSLLKRMLKKCGAPLEKQLGWYVTCKAIKKG